MVSSMNIKDEHGIMFILSAPSGAGKTTLCRMAVDHFDKMQHSVSYTTREPREGENDGRDYNFVSQHTFKEMLDRGEFLEWAEVHGYLYGTSKDDIERLLREGVDAILDVDVQGARQIKSKGKEGVYIFIAPPSLNSCRERIEKRGVNSKDEIEKRLSSAKKELAEALWYDYIIINDTLDNAFNKLRSIIIAEKNRAFRMKPYLPEN